MMRALRGAVVLVLLVAWPASAVAQAFFNAADWYWSVGDTSPSTQVWSSKRGTFVAYADASFQTWSGNQAPFHIVSGAADNGSGLIRLTLEDTGGIGPAKYYTVANVGGTTEANGFWQMTVIDATHVDLVGSSFVHAYTSGGVVPPVTQIDTAVNLYAVINSVAQANWPSNPASQTVALANGTNTLANPLSTSVVLTGAVTTATLRFPAQNLTNSIPLGQPVGFYNTTAQTIAIINAQDNATGLCNGAALRPHNWLFFIPTSNSTANGAFNCFVSLDGQVPWAVAQGGTGDASLTNNGVLYGTGTGAIGATVTMTDGQLVVGNSSGVPAARNPSGGFTLSNAGVATLGNPGPATLGGIESIASLAHNWIASIDTSGVPHQSQPAFSDISGTLAASQCPNPSASTLGCVESWAAVSHQWINQISTSGVPSASQPACGDLSNAGTACPANTGTSGANVPLLNGANTWSGVQTFNSGDFALVDASAAHNVLISPSSSVALTVDRILTLDVVNGARTLKLGANLTLATDPGGVTGALKSNGSGTFAQAAAADLSNGVTGTGAVVLQDSPEITTGLSIGTTTLDAVLTMSKNASTPPANPAGTSVAHLVAADAATGGYIVDVFGTNSSVVFRRADNTNASPQALALNDQIGNFSWRGYNGSAYTGAKAAFECFAAEAWSTTANGTYCNVFTTPKTTATVTEMARFQPSGGLSVGSANVTTDNGNNTVTATTYYSGATAGVTCAGAPTVAFAATNGIVTHC